MDNYVACAIFAAVPLAEKLAFRVLYFGIALGFVLLIAGAAFYLPSVADVISRWIVFIAVSVFVFGYPVYDAWGYRKRLSFWMPLLLMFPCHLALWVYYVRPHFGGDPRLLMGFGLMFLEYIIVSLVMKLVLSA